MIEKIGFYRDYGCVESVVIEQFEQSIGISFPENYKQLISKHNAAWLINREFDVCLKGKLITRDVVFCGYGDAIRNVNRIDRVQQSECAPKGVVVIGKSSEGDYVCFDYRASPESNNPSVVLMLHDYLGEDEELLVCSVADDFDSFIHLLHPSDD